MPRTTKISLDPRTGRQYGDHGSAADAVDFLLDSHQAPGEETEFLKSWRQGSLDEWPEFYEWLAKREAVARLAKIAGVTPGQPARPLRGPLLPPETVEQGRGA